MIDLSNVRMNFSHLESNLMDIKRCLSTLYSTKEGSIPLDRLFGLSPSYLDEPLPIAKNVLAVEIIEKTEKYEPRVKVSEVTYDHDMVQGKIYVTVHLERGEEDANE